jgi:hypothetical protein
MESLDEFLSSLDNDIPWAWVGKALVAFIAARFFGHLLIGFGRWFVRKGAPGLWYWRRSGWLFLVSENSEVTGPVHVREVVFRSCCGRARVQHPDGCLNRGTIYYREFCPAPDAIGVGVLYEGRYIFARQRLSNAEAWYRLERTPNADNPSRCENPPTPWCLMKPAFSPKEHG